MDGMLFIVSGVSAAGKTSIVEGVIRRLGIAQRVITCTSRPPRMSKDTGQTEVDGVDYRFFANEDFVARLQAGEFAENANVYGKRYGTLKQDILNAQQKAYFALAIVDVQGAATLTQLYPDAHSI